MNNIISVYFHCRAIASIRIVRIGSVIEYIAVAITFDGTGSYDPDGTIIKYAWDLDDDGDYDDTFGATPTVSFTAPYSTVES